MNLPTFYIPVQGTWGWDEDPDRVVWWEDGSPLNRYLKERNLVQIPSKRQFLWSTELEGYQFWERFFHTAGHKHRVWKSAALSLCYFCDPIPLHDLNIIAHSHGLQVVAYACGLYGLRIRNLVTVGSPIREDMHQVTLQALKNIGNWAHIYDPHRDDTGMWGEFNDGRFRWPWEPRLAPLADKLFPVQGASHSGTLNIEKFFPVWNEAGDWLRRDGSVRPAPASN